MSDRDNINKIYTTVGRVLEPSAFGEWLSTPIPALDNCTPFHMMSNNRAKELLDYVETYVDASFS